MTDDDRTPPTQVPTDDDHYREYPPGTPVVHGAAVLHRLARLERDQEAMGRSLESLVASRSAQHKLLWLAIPALVGALATALVFAAEKIASSSERAGKLEATVEALKERASKQDAEITQLIEVLLRRGAILEPHRPTSDTPALPDHLSLLDHGASSTPASAIGLSGRVFLQTPKLQNGQGLRMPLPHSMLLLQMEPHVLRGSTVCGAGERASQAMTDAIATTRAILSIPEM